MRSIFGLRLHVHDDDEPEIEEQPAHGRNQAQDDKPQIIGIDGGAEHRGLTDEPGSEWNSGHGQHEEPHRRSQQWGSTGQAGVIGQRGPTGQSARDDRGDGEGAHHLKRVCGDVEPHVTDARRAGHERGHDEAGVSHRRIGQHPLQIGLGDGEQGADDHRRCRHHRNRRRPIIDVGPERNDQHASHGGESGDLGAGRQEPGHASR